MTTVFSHAATGLAIATVIRVPGALGRLVSAGALAAVFPDLDVVVHWFGVPWGHALGHRGISHSVAFAAVLAALLSVTMFRGPGWNGRRGGGRYRERFADVGLYENEVYARIPAMLDTLVDASPASTVPTSTAAGTTRRSCSRTCSRRKGSPPPSPSWLAIAPSTSRPSAPTACA